MSSLSELPIEELYRILDCRKLKLVHKLFDEYEDRFEDFNRESVLGAIRQQYQHTMVKFPVMHNLFSLIWNVPSLPLVVLLAILQAATLSITTILALTGGLVGLAVLLGVFYFYRSYNDYKQSQLKDQNEFDLMLIRLTCTELILQKHHDLNTRGENAAANNNNIQEATLAPSPFIKKFVYKNKDKNRKIQDAVLSGTMNATMLVGTYLLIIATVCAGIGFVAAASAILGPIGLGVSCTIAIGIGIFCAYKHYQSAMATAKRDAFYDFHEKQLAKLTGKCNDIRRDYTSEKTVRRSVSYNGLTSFKHRQPHSSPTLQRLGFLSKKPIATHHEKPHYPAKQFTP